MLKRLMMGLTLLAGLMLLAPVSQAEASSGSWWSKWRTQRNHRARPPHSGRGGGSRGVVPELDPGAAGGALVLLVGGVAYIVSRRREDEDLLA